MALRNRTAAKKQSRTHRTASGGVLVFRATITTNAARGDAKDERSYGSYLRSVSNTREPTAEESAERFLRKKKKIATPRGLYRGGGGTRAYHTTPGLEIRRGGGQKKKSRRSTIEVHPKLL